MRTAQLAGFPSPTRTPLLSEFDYGEYEGRTTKEILAQRPDWQLWRDGCPGGESPQQVLDRARRFLAEATSHAERAVLAFSHGHMIRALAIAFLELPLEYAARLNLETAALSILRAGERGNVLQLWNST